MRVAVLLRGGARALVAPRRCRSEAIYMLGQ